MEGGRRDDGSLSGRSLTLGSHGGLESKDGNAPAATDSPVNQRKCPPTGGGGRGGQRDAELFEIIEKLQGSRIDEQRCAFPPPLKSRLSTLGGDLPLVLPSKTGGYWIDPPSDGTTPLPQVGAGPYELMERDGEATIFREFFCPRYHHSFTAVDAALGPLVLSVCLEEEENRLRVILRTKECSLHSTFSLSVFSSSPSSVDLAKMVCNRVTVSGFQAVSFFKAPELIAAFDEHRLSPNFKFGVLYQKEGQVTEEDILSNNQESEAFRDFLSVLGETVLLRGFEGFRGGLDVNHGQTGNETVFTSYRGREIMFHVATKLPFTDGDPQQLQRKRHVGNDIVALVFQEGRTTFVPDAIKSHFLHCFLVVRQLRGPRPTEQPSFQVSIAAREDVPPFGPVLPNPPTFSNRSVLREFLLTKLINAEISCYKAERFSRLELRTRSMLLESLQAELALRSQCMTGDASLAALATSESARGPSEGTGGFIENFKRAIRVRSHSFETPGPPRRSGGVPLQKTKAERDGESDRSPGATGAPAEALVPADSGDPASPEGEP